MSDPSVVDLDSNIVLGDKSIALEEICSGD